MATDGRPVGMTAARTAASWVPSPPAAALLCAVGLAAIGLLDRVQGARRWPAWVHDVRLPYWLYFVAVVGAGAVAVHPLIRHRASARVVRPTPSSPRRPPAGRPPARRPVDPEGAPGSAGGGRHD
jgi:hypothetical protein